MKVKKLRLNRRTGENRHCLTCNNSFYAPGWLIKDGGGKYCSHYCYGESKKGCIPWNKGVKGVIKPNSGTFTPVNNSPSKQLEVSLYKSIHYFAGRLWGKEKQCEICGTVERKRYHWANLNGKYKLSRNEWKRVCVPCHHKLDKDSYVRGSFLSTTN